MGLYQEVSGIFILVLSALLGKVNEGHHERQWQRENKQSSRKADGASATKTKAKIRKRAGRRWYSSSGAKSEAGLDGGVE